MSNFLHKLNTLQSQFCLTQQSRTEFETMLPVSNINKPKLNLLYINL